MTSKSKRCSWCNTAFFPRKKGGVPQEYCSDTSRQTYGTAARRWVGLAISEGRLRNTDLKPPYTPCAVHRRLSKGVKVPMGDFNQHQSITNAHGRASILPINTILFSPIF